MSKVDTKLFFGMMDNFTKYLPQDLRECDFEIKKQDIITIDQLLLFIEKTFICVASYPDILEDIKSIIDAVIINEKTNQINFINRSRFSCVFKIGQKVFKIGYPKILYEYPKCDAIVDSIIRKQYKKENKSIIFVEVQPLMENNFSECSLQELDQIIYQLWKHFRTIGIVWYDPKIENVVTTSKDRLANYWDNNLYEPSSDLEKGCYDVTVDYNYNSKIPNYLIVDTDLFVPIEAMEQVKGLYKLHPEWDFFANWKFKRFLDFEARYNKEEENAKSHSNRKRIM
jgi:hypothetical protein